MYFSFFLLIELTMVISKVVVHTSQEQDKFDVFINIIKSSMQTYNLYGDICII